MGKKYLITTAQKGATPNREFLRNLELKAKMEDREILILPTKGKSIADEELHPEIQQYTVVGHEMSLNKSLKISQFMINPHQIQPLTGLGRFAQGDKSFIFAATKQHLQYVANSYDDIPKALMTTGAVTQPRYNERLRTGKIAKKDHNYGFIEVDVRDNKYFDFRPYRALVNGSFQDLHYEYRNGKRKKLNRVEALVAGDVHAYYLNKTHHKNTLEQIKELKPKYVVLHDVFDGASISHHYKGHNIKMYEMYRKQGLNLEEELKLTAKVIQTYLNVLPKSSKLVMVASNHDEHLYRYLDEGRFVGDKGNDLMGSKLYTKALEGENPLMFALGLYMSMPNNLLYVERNEGFKVLGVELGHHGDIGSNGARGSPRNIELANGKSITGHGHSAFIIRDTYRVGTSTDLRIGYNIGYSNWTQTNGVLNSNGKMTLLNTIKGKWKQ